MKIRGPAFDAKVLGAQADAVRDAAEAQRSHAIALDSGEALVPYRGANAHLSFTERLLVSERGRPDSPIDWDALPKLRTASRAQIETAWKTGRTLFDASLDLHRLAQAGPLLDEARMQRGSPRREAAMRTEIIGAIDTLKDRLHGLGALGQQLDVSQLDALRALAAEQRRTLLSTPDAPPPRSSDPLARFRGPPPVLEAGRPPNAFTLPPTTALGWQDVARFESASANLARLLDDATLPASLVAARAKVPEAERASFDRAVGGWALLADEATHAPDYQQKKAGGRHRQEYRGRRVSGLRCEGRQEASKARLHRALGQALRARTPADALTAKLMSELGRELGVPAAEVSTWKADVHALTRALADEVFVPLRSLNEGAPRWMKMHDVPPEETKRVVWDLTQSVLEGRFERWRVDNAGSEAQLAHLDEAARQAWLTPMSVKKDTEVAGLTFHTEEATQAPHEIFWATKVGGPSHGFDVMPHCALACFINVRNQVLLAKDPRWPNHAGRAYLRLFADPETKAPVLFLEGMKRDFPYPRQGDLLQRALLEHALEKAEAMGAQLALSPYLAGHIEDMGLKGEWKDARYELAPSLLVEAASIFGEHDWKATEREVRSMRNPQFFVARNEP